MAVTDAGARFYKESKVALSLLTDAERAVAGDQDEPSGLLRVSAPGLFSTMYLAPVLPEFLRRYPAVRLELFCDDRLVDFVAQNFDVALRIGRLPDSSLIARKIARVAILVCAAPAYLERKGVPTSPSDLARHDCLQYEYQWARSGWELSAGEGTGTQVVHLGPGSCRVNNGEVLRQLALAGEGLVQLPDFIVGEDIKAGRLVTVLDDFRPEDRWLQALFLAGRYLPPNVRAFIDFCVERLSSE
jgi:DNA-binding transcriptional LysR family regulator